MNPYSSYPIKILFYAFLFHLLWTKQSAKSSNSHMFFLNKVLIYCTNCVCLFMVVFYFSFSFFPKHV